MKDQAQSSSEILQYSQDKGAFDESTLVVTFITILGVTQILCSFRWVLEGKADKDVPSHQD